MLVFRGVSFFIRNAKGNSLKYLPGLVMFNVIHSKVVSTHPLEHPRQSPKPITKEIPQRFRDIFQRCVGKQPLNSKKKNVKTSKRHPTPPKFGETKLTN